MTGLNDLTRLCPPPRTTQAIDWQAVETLLGMRLPADYKQLASAYGPGAFCDFLHLYHPHAPTPWVNLTGPMPAALREQLREDCNEGVHPVPHDPEHLFAIGVTDNGEYLFWVTGSGSGADPDSWRVAVNEARGTRWHTYDGNLTGFLADVLGGRTTIPQFPDGLLDHGVAFRPSPQPAENTTIQPSRSATGGAVDTKAVRSWARANGYQLPDRGRIPAPVITAYKEANPQ
ncbi:histone-like nucleoid-structuring protein Lsr2 [Streptomyces sp. NPDC045431]|uniref:Lsr2 family DNA-binding protein n=1 Tax=Streptomyces sp. NPDC045431 TaxID=3155613 RepID=UPI0033FC8FFA